jgi:hypothetical protein
MQPIIDNTQLQYNFMDAAVSRPVSASIVRGVAIFWPESDLACGPGSYRLYTVFLPLSIAISETVTFLVRLIMVDGPALLPVRLLASTAFFKDLTPSPSYIKFALPSSFTLDTLESQYFVLEFRSARTIQWHDVVDNEVCMRCYLFRTLHLSPRLESA